MKSLSNGKTFFGEKRLRSLAEAPWIFTVSWDFHGISMDFYGFLKGIRGNCIQTQLLRLISGALAGGPLVGRACGRTAPALPTAGVSRIWTTIG